jgi:hypothetical protein
MTNTAPAHIHSATQTAFIAGPLVQMDKKNWPPAIKIFDKNFYVDNAFAPLLSIKVSSVHFNNCTMINS